MQWLESVGAGCSIVTAMNAKPSLGCDEEMKVK